MFGGRFSSSTGIVGIDFGARSVKMLQVRERRGTLEVMGAVRLDVPLTLVGCSIEPAHTGMASKDRKKLHPADSQMRTAGLTSLADQIRSAFAAGGFRGRCCVVSLAREDVCLQSIRLPKMPDDELHQTAAWEAAQRFGFERQAMEVDFIRTGAIAAGENREEVILIAASHAAINARLEPLLEANLRPVAVDTGFAALARAYSRQARREADREQVRAIVEIGRAGSTVLILRGDQIAFCKPVAIGGMQFDQAVSEHLQMDQRAAGDLRAARIEALAAPGSGQSAASTTDPATDRAVFEAVRPLMNELVKEVTLCMRYYGVTFRGHPPDRIILSGGDGMEPRLGEVMAASCKTPVVFDDAADTLGGLIGGIQSSLNRMPGPASSWAVPLGLSLRDLSQKKVREQREPATTVREAA